MAVVNGNDIGVYIGGVLIGCLTSNTFNSQREEIVTTCKDNNGAKTVLLGGLDASVDFEGNFNPASTYSFGDLVALHKNKTEVSLAFGDNTNLTIHAQALLPTLSWSGPLNAASTFSGKFTVTGEWTYSET